MSTHPKFSSHISEWIAWADANYPFDGSNPRRASGWDAIRATQDPELRADMAQAMCRTMAPQPIQEAAVAAIPKMPDFGYNNQPESVEPDPLFGDRDGW